MLVSTVIALAKKSELKQLAIKDDDVAIIGFINLGMLALYTRFPLKQEEAIITLQTGQAIYPLDGTDANVSMGSADDFLIVSECYDEQGDVVTINDETDPLGILTPSWNTIEVPNVAQDERLSLIYRSAPAFVTQPTNSIPLPPQLLEALLNFIGYRGHGTISSDVKAENNTHYMRFDASCKKAEENGMIVIDDLLYTQKFYDRGFV